MKRTLGVPLFQEQLLRIAMAAADFTGGEAEELRRAMGFKRSTARMKVIEGRLREGMAAKGIVGKTQDTIVDSITAFAKYGFPESHAASFALLAYASAFLKVHHLAAFTAAILNNQPMGFYSPAVLVKDAQRHGLRVLPIDITRSNWNCTIEEMNLRLGLRYARGLRGESALHILRERETRAATETVSIEVGSVLPTSDRTFEVEWTETTRDLYGAIKSQDRWKAAFSIVVNPPTDERMARINPLGIYVTNANWGKVL